MAIFKGKVERIRDSHVEGWLAGSGTPPELELYVDGEAVATAWAQAAGGDGRAPFRIAVPGGLRDGGVHKIAVKVRGAPVFLNAIPLISVIGDGVEDEEPLPDTPMAAVQIAPQPPEIAAPEPSREAPEVEPDPEPEPEAVAPRKLRKPGEGGVPVHMPEHMTGHVDAAQETWLHGWIVDRTRPGPVELALYIDNRPALTAMADVFRPDVQKDGNGDGRCGFNFDIPRQFWDNALHRADIRLADDPGHSLFPPVLVVIPPGSAPREVGERKVLVYADQVRRGKRRVLIKGRAAWNNSSPILELMTLRLGERTARVPRLESRAGGHALYQAVFDWPEGEALPDVLTAEVGGVRGEAVIHHDQVRTATRLAQVGGDGRWVTGYAIDLDGEAVAAGVRGPAGDVAPVMLEPGDIHGEDGPLNTQVRVAIEDVLRPLYGRDPGFAAGETVSVVLIDGAGRGFAAGEAPVRLAVKLNVERVVDGRVVGWMVNEDRKDLFAEADLYIDGVRFGAVVADGSRQDVVDDGRTEAGGGLDILPFNPGEGDDVEVSLVERHGGAVLAMETVPVAALPEPAVAGAWPHLLHAGERRVTTIVWRGETEALNRAVTAAGDDDVLLVAPDVALPVGAVAGLKVAAWSDARVATASALADRGGAFAVPEPFVVNVSDADRARRVRRAARGVYPRVPVGNDFCLYIRREALDRVGGFDAGLDVRDAVADFCLRAVRAGWSHVADDRTWVGRAPGPAGDGISAVMAAKYPEYAALAWPDLPGVQWRIRRAVLAGERPKPRCLYVIATRTGGTPQTNRDLMGAVSGEVEPWLLVSDGMAVELLYEDAVVERIALRAPVTPGLHRSADYDDAVARLILKYGFELVHIRHLAWHGAGLPGVAQALGVPVVFSFHDFYTVCPSIKLLDERGVHCAGKCTATAGECAVELWPQDAFPPLKHAFIHRWREIFAEALKSCDAFVTTSPGARDLVLEAFPALRGKPFEVIGHGRDFASFADLAEAPGEGPLKVLVPGNISPAKGADLINAVIELDTDRRIEWHLLGDSGQIRSAPNVVAHGTYARDDFAERVAAIGPNVGAVLSIWPETWCHTLTELWACGVPVVAIDIGAVGERLAEHGGGWRLPRDTTAQALYEAISALRESDWRDRVAEVAAWQAGAGTSGDTAIMGAAYLRLYREVMARD